MKVVINLNDKTHSVGETVKHRVEFCFRAPVTAVSVHTKYIHRTAGTFKRNATSVCQRQHCYDGTRTVVYLPTPKITFLLEPSRSTRPQLFSRQFVSTLTLIPATASLSPSSSVLIVLPDTDQSKTALAHIAKGLQKVAPTSCLPV